MARLAKAAMRIFRALEPGVANEGAAGMIRAPQDGHMVTTSSIGSAQRQHALVIAAPSALLIDDLGEDRRVQLNMLDSTQRGGPGSGCSSITGIFEFKTVQDSGCRSKGSPG
jgi:hypothetical protein